MKNSAIYVLFTSFLLLPACNQNDSDPQGVQQITTPLNQVSLKPVQSCPALKQIFIDNWVENLLSYERILPGEILPLNSILDNSLSATTGDAVAESNPDNVSQTNNQEAGVNEADSVKTDSLGNLFIAQHDKLVIADAFPPQTMNTLSTLDLGGRVSGLYLSEQDKLVIALVTPEFQPVNGLIGIDAAIAPYIWMNPKTDVVFIDISNLSVPTITRKIRLDGNLINSRRTGSRLHIVQNYYLNQFFYASDVDIQSLLAEYHRAFTASNTTLMDEIKIKIKQLVEDKLDIDEAQALLPKFQVINNEVIEKTQFLSCNEIFAPDIDLQRNELLTVTSIDLSGDSIQQVAAIGSGWITYASLNDLFIVQPGFNWWWNSHQHQQSAIHHFSISDNKPTYLSSGLVKGYINDSFNMSYFEESLRVATTQNLWALEDRSDIRSTNHLYVLKDNASNGMDIISAVEQYADNERIFSARFLGDKAFIVTFRQIDPLFSFDLSDPQHPFIAGELKIPGFSTYMHPIDDTHLLTIGRDGTNAGAGDQIAIKLFDVSDLSTPVLVDSYSPKLKDGYSWSQASWDHHAFTYYAPEKMLAVPVASYSGQNDDYFMGILAINVDLDNGLSLAGRVDHEDLLQQVNCDNSVEYCNAWYYRWLAQPTRSVFMSENSDSYLYSLSNIGVKAVNIDNFETTAGSLLLPSPEDFYGFYY